MDQDEVEHIKRADRLDSGNQGRFSVPVKSLERESARIDFSTFFHELNQTLIHCEVPWERFVPESRESSLNAECDSRAVEQDRGFEPLPEEAGCCQGVYQADRSFEGNRMKRYQRLFPRLGFDILEYLLFVIDEIISFFMSCCCYCGHGIEVLFLRFFILNKEKTIQKPLPERLAALLLAGLTYVFEIPGFWSVHSSKSATRTFGGVLLATLRSGERLPPAQNRKACIDRIAKWTIPLRVLSLFCQISRCRVDPINVSGLMTGSLSDNDQGGPVRCVSHFPTRSEIKRTRCNA